MTFYIYSKAGCVVIDAWLVDCVQLQIQSFLTHCSSQGMPAVPARVNLDYKILMSASWEE